MDLRKHLIVVEEIGSEGGHKLARPVRRVAGIAVIVNPNAGRNVEDLSPLFDVGAELLSGPAWSTMTPVYGPGGPTEAAGRQNAGPEGCEGASPERTAAE